MTEDQEDKVVSLPHLARPIRPSKRVLTALESVKTEHMKQGFKRIVIVTLDSEGDIGLCDGGFKDNENITFRGMLDHAKDCWEITHDEE